MGSPKEIIKPFSNKGLQLKSDPSLLDEGSYQELSNLVSNIEGELAVRLGAEDVGNLNPASFSGTYIEIHTITRVILSIPFPGPLFYFLGIADKIMATNQAITPGAGMTFTQIASGCADATVSLAYQKFATAEYAVQGFTQKYFACPLKMLRFTGQLSSSIGTFRWGIIPPLIPAIATNTAVGSGPPTPTGPFTPYTYVYTFSQGPGGTDSNPSVVMTSGVTPNGHQIEITLTPSTDPQVNTIKIYRAGGSFADGDYRFLASVPASTTTYEDISLDQDIASNPIADFDNDPPVTATLPTSYVANAVSFASGTGAAGTINTLNLDYSSGYTSVVSVFATPGTLFFINDGSPETVTVISSTASTITVYFQNTHTLPFLVICSAQTASPCTIALTAFNSIFLAGNALGPHILYKSKTSQPTYFPVLELSTGISDAIIVGTPSNPIMALVEYGGSIISMNYECIFYVSVFQGQMQTPVTSPAKRGLITRKAYVKVSNEIWYLSYDGIYSFAGGEEQWRSEQIDPLFRGIPIGNYLPINMAPGQNTVGLDIIEFSFTDNEIRMNYTDTANVHHVLRYHMKFQRWSIDTYNSAFGNVEIFSQYTEDNDGTAFLGVDKGAGATAATRLQFWNIENGTSDGWITTPTDGTAIQFAESMNTIDIAPATDKLFSDFLVEAANPSNALAIATYYNWSTIADGTDAFAIAPSGIARTRYPFPLHNSQGMYAYAMQLRVSGTSTTGCSLYTLTVHYVDLATYTKGFAFDYSDEGYADDKVLRWLDLECDTGGIAATLNVQIDSNTTAFTTTFTTTYPTRNITITMPSNLIGRMIRLVLIPGAGGKINYYKHAWNFAKEPAAITAFDSLEMTFGWNGYSFLKQCWVEYSCASPVTIAFYSDGDQEFYQLVMPAHPQREVERFYLPAYVDDILNKSKTHRFVLSSATALKLYGESSRLEWLACGADQRSAYQQASFTQLTAPAVA